jgi:hypothetical protein
VALEENHVSGVPGAFGPEEMIEAHFVNVALEAKVEMWPPMPACWRLARTTMAMAFQRMMLLMRRSISRLPGKAAWLATGMVLI